VRSSEFSNHNLTPALARGEIKARRFNEFPKVYFYSRASGKPFTISGWARFSLLSMMICEKNNDDTGRSGGNGGFGRPRHQGCSPPGGRPRYLAANRFDRFRESRPARHLAMQC
jgi:hypothetical protein